VTPFQVRKQFLDNYEVKTVGSSIHQEYWIPAADLVEFNRNIMGQIEVIAEFGDQGECMKQSKEATRVILVI